MKFPPIFFQGGKGGGAKNSAFMYIDSVPSPSQRLWGLMAAKPSLAAPAHSKCLHVFFFHLNHFLSVFSGYISISIFKTIHCIWWSSCICLSNKKNLFVPNSDHLELLVPPARPVWYPSPPVLRSGEPCRNIYTLNWSSLCIPLRYVATFLL